MGEAADGAWEHDRLNVYGEVIVEEARRRGIDARVLDAPEPGECYLLLSHGGREIVALDSLSELTSAVAVSWCADKRVSRRLLADAGLRVPRARQVTCDDGDARFLAEVGELVVKPVRGEQGHGVTVGVHDAAHLAEAIEQARRHSREVLLEERTAGEDVRVIVIGHEVVAAALRRPPRVTGSGRHTIAELIEEVSRRRAEQTNGESRIPIDEDTRETLADAGYDLDDVPAEGETLAVRRTANLHTGGTMEDVTGRLAPEVVQACVRASRVLRIPLVGLDLLMPSVEGGEYVLIEANERPGLAFHGPAPVVQRFVDLLFPDTARC